MNIKIIFEQRVRKQVEIDEIQMGFMSEKGKINGIFSVRQMTKYKAAGRQLLMMFVALEKAIERVPGPYNSCFKSIVVGTHDRPKLPKRKRGYSYRCSARVC